MRSHELTTAIPGEKRLKFRLPQVDSKPTNSTQRTDQSHNTQAQFPAETSADPRSDHGREQTNAISTCVHNGGCGPAPITAEINGHGPKGRFAQPQETER